MEPSYSTLMTKYSMELGRRTFLFPVLGLHCLTAPIIVWLHLPKSLWGYYQTTAVAGSLHSEDSAEAGGTPCK